MFACQEGHYRIVEMLVDNGAHDKPHNKVTQTHACIHAFTLYDVGMQSVCLILLQNGISALMIACNKGHAAAAQVLLDSNANINLQALVCLLN